MITSSMKLLMARSGAIPPGPPPPQDYLNLTDVDLPDFSDVELTGTGVHNSNSFKGFFWKSDGTKLFTVDSSNDNIYEWSLSTAWDFGTASSVNTLNVTSYENQAHGISLSSDGTRLYIVGSGSDSVHEWTLSTAWDLSTASYSYGLSVSSQDSTPRSFSFKPDGTKMFVTGITNDAVYDYDLSTAWDLSTATATGNSASDATYMVNPGSALFNTAGTVMYVPNIAGNINKYTLSTAWDVSTATYDSQAADSNSIGPTNNGLYNISWNSDGTTLYVSCSFCIRAVSLSTAYDISTASYTYSNVNYFSYLSLLSSTSGNGGYISPDGDYVMFSNAVGKYAASVAISTPEDLSTASGSATEFDFSTNTGSNYALHFKPDGTKMFLCAYYPDDAVDEYSLSTAWDISTASYTTTFAISTQEIYPYAIRFKPDGTKMYVLGNSGDDINEYSLSTAWDISTASYSQTSGAISTDVPFPVSLAFSADGTRAYISGYNDIFQYQLTTAWDVSTMSTTAEDSLSYSSGVASEVQPNADNNKLYIYDSNRGIVVLLDAAAP